MGKGSAAGTITCQVSFKNLPHVGQMKAGVHREEGIVNGEPLLANLPRPHGWRPDASQTNLLGGGGEDKADDLSKYPGWERRVTPEGVTYFVDHNTKTTHWEHPSKLNKGSGQPAVQDDGHVAMPKATLRYKSKPKLPPHVEQRRDPQGRIYYIDHQTKTTSWSPPVTQGYY